MKSWIGKGKFFSLLAAVCFGGILAGAEAPGPELSKEEMARNVKIGQLKEQRQQLLLKMNYMRITLIRKDSRLLALQKEIIRRSRELALELNATREMSKLNDDLAKLDDELEKLENSHKNKNGNKKEKK